MSPLFQAAPGHFLEFRLIFFFFLLSPSLPGLIFLFALPLVQGQVCVRASCVWPLGSLWIFPFYRFGALWVSVFSVRLVSRPLRGAASPRPGCLQQEAALTVAATLERRSAALQRISVFLGFFISCGDTECKRSAERAERDQSPRGVLKYCPSCGKSAHTKIMLTARVQSLKVFSGPVCKIWLNL